jgi:hypothetical protein
MGVFLMSLYYMSFVKDGVFAGACMVHADTPHHALTVAWQRGCNPGGEVLLMNPVNIPDEKWFYRILNKDELRELEAELNAKYQPENPRLTPILYN